MMPADCYRTGYPQASDKYVEVRLTPSQAWAVLRALGNVTDHPDAMDALFSHHLARGACHRGEDAIRDAVTEWEKSYLTADKRRRR